jgi:hypothetical protein
MCGEKYVVERRNCSDCKGNVIGANGDDWDSHCHSCGIVVDQDVEPPQ